MHGVLDDTSGWFGASVCGGLGAGAGGPRLVTGSCVIRETTQTGCPWSRPRVSLSIYLSIYLIS